jgi:hypothetical protein
MTHAARRSLIPTLLAVTLAFAGCASGVRLHDVSRAKVASNVKETYAKANVLSTIEVEKKNLDKLLEEELKAVRDNQRLRVDFALLRIADDGAPMAETFTTKASRRLTELGFEADPASGVHTTKQVRESVRDQGQARSRTRQLTVFAEVIKTFGRVDAPPCVAGAPLPERLTFPPDVPAEARAPAEEAYREYLRTCATHQKAPPPPGRLLRQAREAWETTLAEVAALDRTLDEARTDVETKSKAHADAEAAVKKAATAGAATQKALQDRAAQAAQALDQARTVAGLIEVRGLAARRVEALVQLLTAAAGGTVDTQDPAVKAATDVAGQIPSLAGDVKDLLARGRAPSVHNLLIELRHQVVLLERAKQLRAFAQQRADLARAQYDALWQETELWLRFSDALCSYAVVASDPTQWPGPRCDGFSVKVDPPGQVECRLRDTLLSSCALARPWNQAIRTPINDVATRELYKALAVYLQALAAQGTQNEQTFRMVDVRHREALTTREAALRGWDNLVAVPVDQLDAYYQAGLKPAEIADLLVKALGFAAIAFGVAQ